MTEELWTIRLTDPFPVSWRRFEQRGRRRYWRRIDARELTKPLLADGRAYHLRSLARRRRR